MIKRVPKFFVSLIIIGYLFAFFSLFDKTKQYFGLASFLVAAVLHLVLILSNEYQSSRHLSLASKYIEKGDSIKAYEEIITASKLFENEEELYRLFHNKNKFKDTVKKVANLISQNFENYDTPYLRLIAAMFYYIGEDLIKAKNTLLVVDEDKLTIKMARLLGSIFYELKDYNLALKYLSLYDPPYLPMNEDELAVVFGMGLCFLGLGERNKAIEYFSRVETKNPKFGNVQKILDNLLQQDQD